jgi:hypothetical protein
MANTLYKLVSCNPNKQEIEIKSDAGATRMQLEDDCGYVLNGSECSIRDLQAGDSIELRYKLGKILKVVATRVGNSKQTVASQVSKSAKKKSAPAKKPAAQAAAGDPQDVTGGVTS